MCDCVYNLVWLPSVLTDPEDWYLEYMNDKEHPERTHEDFAALLDEVLKMRKADKSICLKEYFDRLLPCVINRKASGYRKSKEATRVSDMYTSSDEAFVLAVLEEKWDPWMQFFKEHSARTVETNELTMPSHPKKNFVRAKSSKNYMDQKLARQHQSLSTWTEAGLRRLDELDKLVKEDRREDGRKLEDEYLKWIQSRSCASLALSDAASPTDATYKPFRVRNDLAAVLSAMSDDEDDEDDEPREDGTDDPLYGIV